MKIEMQPRIIDDDGVEIREQDFAFVQTKTMSTPSLALVQHIAISYVELVFVDVLLSNIPTRYRIKDILTMKKSK